MNNMYKEHKRQMLIGLVYAILIGLTVFFCSGCSNIAEQIRKDRELMATPFYDGADKIDPYDRASYYASQYPTCTQSEKADMLYQCLKHEGHDPIMVETARIVIDKSIILNGEKVWPVVLKKSNIIGIDRVVNTTGGTQMIINNQKDNN
jgi:hypothetical protein